MTGFRLLLLALLMVILAYTGIVVAEHGWNLFPAFFGAVGALGWQGQFNVDFSCFLLLSGLWVAWRHRWSAGGIALGVLASLLGALFLTVYLLVAGRRATNVAALLTRP